MKTYKVEVTERQSMYRKGYRYEMIPVTVGLDILYSKTLQGVADWMREYPDHCFHVVGLDQYHEDLKA